MRGWIFSFIAFTLGFISCSDDRLFSLRDNSEIGINFMNTLEDKKGHNIFSFRNYYNGGGVGIGDLNNDGLLDIYFTANQKSNKLFLNKGNWVFEDITEKAGVGGKKFWSTGVSLVDINADGWLDIYVCNSGNVKGTEAENELFINQKDGTFKEQAKEYGLADRGLTTHALFFDYDLDGDLDCYILNNSFRPIESFDMGSDLRSVRDSIGGDRLFRNDNDLGFVDVTYQAGIFSSDIGFGLGVSSADFNQDGYPDIYVSNDFFEKDYLYINQKDGTFKETITESVGHVSLASMGSDVADINNDGYIDIFTTEMLPEEDKRLKEITNFETYDVKTIKNQGDFYNQYMQNCLQLNNGNNTYSEIAFQLGVATTDWSWGALFFDMDNNGLKDLYVSNGIYKDLTNQDFLNFLADDKNIKKLFNRKTFNYKEFISKMPSTKIQKYAFSNRGDIRFEPVTQQWGLDQKSFSNGAAYGDLDNDGDLDLVVNNLEDPPFIYENISNQKLDNHFLKIRLFGMTPNTMGIGTTIKIFYNNTIQMAYVQSARGFQSSVPPNEVIFGIDKYEKIDSLQVIWQDHSFQTLKDIKANRLLSLYQKDAKGIYNYNKSNFSVIFKDISKKVFDKSIVHKENINYVDYDNNHLQPQSFSQESPSITLGDYNGDSMEDILLTGAKNDYTKLLFQKANQKFIEMPFSSVKEEVDVTASASIDYDKDGDKDILLAYGGNEYSDKENFFPTLWQNNGSGQFKKVQRISMSVPFLNTSCIRVCDYDKDGDEDFFLGTRSKYGEYGTASPCFIFINKGNGNFEEINMRTLLQNEKFSFSMVTDACWSDIDNNGWDDLLIVGNWMGVKVFLNTKGKLTYSNVLSSYTGWWSSIRVEDIDGDGNKDILLGNLGTNSKFYATENEPMDLYIKDMDNNGTKESLICMYKSDHQQYCFQMRRELIEQMPSFKKKFLTYNSYAGTTFNKVFSNEELSDAIHRQIRYLQSGILWNKGKLQFTFTPLPIMAQLAPINSFLFYGLYQGKKMYILSGNYTYFRPEVGRLDANRGLVLLIDTIHKKMEILHPANTGLNLDGEVRSATIGKFKDNNKWIAFGLNNSFLKIYSETK